MKNKKFNKVLSTIALAVIIISTISTPAYAQIKAIVLQDTIGKLFEYDYDALRKSFGEGSNLFGDFTKLKASGSKVVSYYDDKQAAYVSRYTIIDALSNDISGTFDAKKAIETLAPTPIDGKIYEKIENADGVVVANEKSTVPTDITVITTTEGFKSAIKTALERFDDSVFMEIKGYSDSLFDINIINTIIIENPLIDYGYSGANSKVTWTGDGSDRKVTITFQYNKTKAEMIEMKKQAEQKSLSIIKEIIKAGMKDSEKELAIHDYIVNNTRYDSENIGASKFPADDYTDYGVLINNKGVCSGYAKAVIRLLNLVGIQSYYVTGTADAVPHAWNMVKIEGIYYHLDATWDDPLSTSGSNINILRHDYFNLTDTEIGKNHIWDKSIYPKCTTLWTK